MKPVAACAGPAEPSGPANRLRVRSVQPVETVGAVVVLPGERVEPPRRDGRQPSAIVAPTRRRVPRGPVAVQCPVAGLEPVAVLGPIATLALSDATTTALLRTVNSLVYGPFLVGAFAVVMNRLLTHPEVRNIPVVRHTLPERDPDSIVLTSAALGTVFYLLAVGAATGTATVLP